MSLLGRVCYSSIKVFNLHMPKFVQKGSQKLPNNMTKIVVTLQTCTKFNKQR